MQYAAPPPGAEVVLTAVNPATATGNLTLATGTRVSAANDGGCVTPGGPGVEVGDVVPPQEADPATWSVTFAPGETADVLVEVSRDRP